MNLAEHFGLGAPEDSSVELLAASYVHGLSATSRRLRRAALEHVLYDGEERQLLEQAAALLDRPLEHGLGPEPNLIDDSHARYPYVRRRVWEILAAL